MEQGDEVPTHSCATAPDFHRLRHVKSRSNADTMELRKGHSTTAYDAARGRRPLRSLPAWSNHGSKQQPWAPSLPPRKDGLIASGTLPPQPGPSVSPHAQRAPLQGELSNAPCQAVARWPQGNCHQEPRPDPLGESYLTKTIDRERARPTETVSPSSQRKRPLDSSRTFVLYPRSRLFRSDPGPISLAVRDV